MKSYIILFITVCLLSCTDAIIRSETADGADFSNLKSYAWLPSPSGDSIRYYKFNDAISSSGVKEAVNKELKSRGYIINTENPDFFVRITTKFREQLDTINDTESTAVNVQPYSSYRIYNPQNQTGIGAEYYDGHTTLAMIENNLRTTTYTEGTLYIDLIKKEENKNKIIWMGWSERALDNGEIKKDMVKDVHEIFEDEFPVKPKKK